MRPRLILSEPKPARVSAREPRRATAKHGLHRAFPSPIPQSHRTAVGTGTRWPLARSSPLVRSACRRRGRCNHESVPVVGARVLPARQAWPREHEGRAFESRATPRGLPPCSTGARGVVVLCYPGIGAAPLPGLHEKRPHTGPLLRSVDTSRCPVRAGAGTREYRGPKKTSAIAHDHDRVDAMVGDRASPRSSPQHRVTPWVARRPIARFSRVPARGRVVEMHSLLQIGSAAKSAGVRLSRGLR